MELVELMTKLDAPLVLVVGVFIVRYLSNQNDKKDNEIRSLNAYIRTSDKENIKTLEEFSRFLETLISDMASMKSDMVREIASSAENVKAKIDNLKTIMEHNAK